MLTMMVMDTTGIFTIFGSSINDIIMFPVSNLSIEDTLKMPHDEWSFMLALFEISPTIQKEERFAIDTVELEMFPRQKFELSLEDI